MADVTGIVLAAGAGTRAGGPKSLLRLPSEQSWIAASVAALGACSRVVVVLGAQAQIARPLVPAGAEVVVAADWELGMSASLRAGLAAATGDAALITLVDLPGLPPSVIARVLAAPGDLRQATFDARPGHPVYIAASHWSSASASVSGDSGARSYLLAHSVTQVECSDLWDGVDRDFG